MTNRILNVSMEDRSLDPISAEVWVTVRLERLTPATEVRGKLMGPSCPYATTVEIAYPLTPLKRPEQQEPGTIRCRAVIPEASLWDLQSPFLYSGPVELWQDGERTGLVTVRHGLRRIQLGPRGLRLNGKPLTLSGRPVERLTEDEALTLRREGCNLLLARGAADVWDIADRFGFLVLGEQPHEGHPSCLGWLSGEKAAIQGIEIGLIRERNVLVLRGETELGRVIL